MNKISIIVPCYNEEEVISLFYTETCKTVTAIPEVTYEFIFVDDGTYLSLETLEKKLLCMQD